jgi:diadenosine tetraphosphate (Ap4A) HIT family hydrolase
VSDGCHICELRDGATESQVVYRDDNWTMASPVGVPGWVMLFPNRHDEGIWELDEQQSAQLGQLAVALAKCLRDVCQPECVYVMYAGETALHTHVMAIARGAEIPEEWRGGAIIAKYAELLDEAEATRVVEALRGSIGALLPA